MFLPSSIDRDDIYLVSNVTENCMMLSQLYEFVKVWNELIPNGHREAASKTERSSRRLLLSSKAERP